jgi:tRNA(fMet)-specific endonuclease VapC
VTGPRTGILDTNAVILLDQLRPEFLPPEPAITVITLAELTVGPLVADDPAERASRQLRLQETESSFDALPFDAAAARAYGRVAADLRRAGRRLQARAFDVLIAATAIANELPLYTCNPRDFSGIDGLDVVTIPHPDQADRGP